MTTAQTAVALAGVLREHHAALVDMLADQAPAAGSRYEQMAPAELRARIGRLVDACTTSIAANDPQPFAAYLRGAAAALLANGYSLDSLITMAMLTEGALSDTVALAFEEAPAAERAEADALVRGLMATASRILETFAGETPPPA